MTITTITGSVLLLGLILYVTVWLVPLDKHIKQVAFLVFAILVCLWLLRLFHGGPVIP